ncbi:hybrid sensor histidine kinase/response regulator [Roseicella sp. DB1501]|uniref:ATP-binding protein n=1 Tax=Roseicella sp. DB1501 TaxID=2730925 RepID=UPI0014920E2E|nr:PAS domain-containing protein [Roseicella sp. DB1501]
MLVLAPGGRDAAVAAAILREAGIVATVCRDLPALVRGLDQAGAAVLTEEALARADLRDLAGWTLAQPPWSDFPFVVLTRRGGGSERNPEATRLAGVLGNVAFLERPFHPTILASAVRSALAARRRQHQARDALAAETTAAERLRFALRAGRLGSWEFDGRTGEFRASEACKAVFGRAPGDCFGYPDLLAAIHPDDLERMQDAVATALSEGGDYDIEYRTVWPDGSAHWAEVRGRAFRDETGRILMAGVSLDTTARRAAEAELRRHRGQLEEQVAERTRELEAANRRLRAAAEERDQVEAALLQAQKMEAVGQLTGGLAHDFNNLLQAVLASLDLIHRRAADPAQVEKLAAAGGEAARRGARLTAQLLAFSRKQKMDLTPVAAGELVEGMRDLLARSLGPGVALRLEVDRGAGLALADATQLELAVLNLAINARDAMPGGGTLTVAVRVVELGLAADLPVGRYVAVSVSDTGDGMAPEVVARAFEPFFTTKGVGKGTGLGLSQVYGIARQSGGTARIESVPGHGTTVRILLPAVGSEAARTLARQPENAMTGGSPVTAATSAGALVLVVDDDPDVRRALVGWLDALGYRVAEAADGRAGLAALERLAPDAMLVDFAMPGLTGAEVAVAARRLRPGLPIVLATGYAAAAELGVDAPAGLPMLRKPFRIQELAEVLAQALTRS